jgi:IS5 family transposase
MKRQKTFASAISFEKYRKPTKRELFLAEMEQIVPWKELCARLEPFYPKEGKGRPPIGLENACGSTFSRTGSTSAIPV